MGGIQPYQPLPAIILNVTAMPNQAIKPKQRKTVLSVVRWLVMGAVVVGHWLR